MKKYFCETQQTLIWLKLQYTVIEITKHYGWNYNIIIAHLNINSFRNKFNFLAVLADIVKDNIDILMISESKLDDSFPDSQFFIEGFGKPFRLDRNRNGGGIMLFIQSDIPA